MRRRIPRKGAGGGGLAAFDSPFVRTASTICPPREPLRNPTRPLSLVHRRTGRGENQNDTCFTLSNPSVSFLCMAFTSASIYSDRVAPPMHLTSARSSPRRFSNRSTDSRYEIQRKKKLKLPAPKPRPTGRRLQDHLADRRIGLTSPGKE